MEMRSTARLQATLRSSLRLGDRNVVLLQFRKVVTKLWLVRLDQALADPIPDG